MKTDREKLIKVLQNNPYGQYTYEEFADYLISKGVTIPVRCGECRYKDEIFFKGKGFPICRVSGRATTETAFCSYGERKEDD